MSLVCLQSFSWLDMSEKFLLVFLLTLVSLHAVFLNFQQRRIIMMPCTGESRSLLKSSWSSQRQQGGWINPELRGGALNTRSSDLGPVYTKTGFSENGAKNYVLSALWFSFHWNRTDQCTHLQGRITTPCMASRKCRKTIFFEKKDIEAENRNDQNVSALKLAPSQTYHVALCSNVTQSRSNKHFRVTVAELLSRAPDHRDPDLNGCECMWWTGSWLVIQSDCGRLRRPTIALLHALWVKKYVF